MPTRHSGKNRKEIISIKKIDVQRKAGLWLCVFTGLLVGASSAKADLVKIERKATEFDRYFFADESKPERVKQAGNLSGKVKPEDQAIVGWFEYDFEAPKTGWYEILVQPCADNHEYLVDGKDYVYASASGQKIGNNFRLNAGRHTLRIQRYIWTGFGPITGFTVKESSQELGKRVRVVVNENRTLLRKGESLKLAVYSGGNSNSATLNLCMTDQSGKETIQTNTVKLPPSSEMIFTPVSIPCEREGSFKIMFADGETPIDPKEIYPISFNVVDTTPITKFGGEIKKSLIKEIDCVATPPDYFGGGDTRVISKSFGKYRESSNVGWLDHMNATDPSWFAYRVEVPEGQKPYLFEIDYPDDALRTFCVAIRGSKPGSYPTAGGVDSGGEYSLSNRMLTHSIIHWSKGTDLRVVLIVPRTGKRAAASRIRVYKVEEPLLPLKASVPGDRSFGNWYEEGGSVYGLYAAPDGSLDSDILCADRWCQSVGYMGGDTLVYTFSIYGFSTHPSKYVICFNGPFTPDTIGAMTMKCEKYGMKFVGELHPRADELAWHRPKDGSVQCNFMINKDGKTATTLVEPGFNPLHPVNQAWYLGLIGEFVDRYEDSPAFKGISLRLMTWCNPGFNNFLSLDWGYDDYTIQLFEKETGLKIPSKPDDPGRFLVRYDWLMANAKERWITWRCEKIAEIYKQVCDRVRKARPDLLVYSDVFGGFPDLREAGVDVKLLSAIDGVCLVNALSAYGRRGTEKQNQELRNAQVNPEILNSVRGATGLSGYLFGAGYFEATEAVLPPESLGYPADAKKGWMSGVVNPSGRHYLERWALALAEGDATYLSDGGNAYTLGQPLLREFLAEYRCLPAARFVQREDARDPVAVAELKRGKAFLFYAVNRERFPVKVQIEFTKPGILAGLFKTGSIRRLSTGEAVALRDNRFELELQPYQLLTFTAPAGTSIQKVSVTVSEDALRQVKTQVEWLQKLVEDVKAGRIGKELSAEQREYLSKSVEEAKDCLAKGRVWRARTLLEDSRLLAIFDVCCALPPFLRDDGAPEAPAGALKAAELAKCVLETNAVRVVNSEEVVKDWPAERLLIGAAPLTIKIDVPLDGRYRFEAGYVYGGVFAKTEVAVNGEALGTLAGFQENPHGTVATLPKIVSLKRGEAQLEFRPQAGKQTGLSYLRIIPVFTDILKTRWLAIGPFPGDQKDVDKAMQTVFPPETNLNFEAETRLAEGKVVRWRALEGMSDFVDLNPINVGSINYAVTYIYAPTARRVRLCYGMDYWMKMWLNGALFKEYAPHGGAPFKGQFSQEVDLKEGWNQLLVKVASGSAGNGLWMSISNPGDLRFSARKEIKTEEKSQ